MPDLFLKHMNTVNLQAEMEMTHHIHKGTTTMASKSQILCEKPRTESCLKFLKRTPLPQPSEL